MLDRVQKTRLRHAFSFPLSAIGHPPPAPASGSGPLFHSLWSCAGMQTLKKVPPRKPLRLLNKRVVFFFFFCFPAPNPGVAVKIQTWAASCGNCCGCQVAPLWWPPGSAVGPPPVGAPHWNRRLHPKTVRSRKGCHGTNAKDS